MISYLDDSPVSFAISGEGQETLMKERMIEMKKWNKAIAIGLCACMMGTAAIAETAETAMDTVTGATQTATIPQNQQTPPEMPGQQGQGEQNQMMMPPPMPGQQGQGEQNQMMPPAMPGQQGQGEQNQMMPPAMPGQQAQGQQNQMTPPDVNNQNNENGQQMTPPDMNNQSSENGQQMTPPDMNNQNSENGQQMTPPDMNNQNSQNGQQMTPPDMNNQNSENGQQMTPPDMNNQNSENGQRMAPPSMNGQNGQQMPGGMPGNASANVSYTAAATVTENSSNATYTSTGNSENAVLVSGENVTISNATVSKTGSASGDEADFYGVNATVLATGGATLNVEAAEITSDGEHANGVFSYGSGTTVNVSDTSITTSGNCSGGLMTTGGATLNATNVTVATSGNSSAAIRSDRGGGTVNVNGGTYDTTGVGSPAIYSTADITVSDATLSATTSEAVVIEGGNTVTLNNVDITGSNTKLNGQSKVNTNVLIYQSMSGDASEGESSFTMTDGSMTAETGAMFHVTNTTTTINLENVDFTYASDSNVFLSASADSWGRSGQNGGDVTLNLKNQDITGAILSDSLSSVSVNLDSDSTWTLTGDSYVTSFNGDLSNVNLNGYTLYVNGVAVTK